MQQQTGLPGQLLGRHREAQVGEPGQQGADRAAAISLDVRAWYIVGRPKAGSGCPVSIPSLALPVRSGKLIAEMMTYRPED